MPARCVVELGLRACESPARLAGLQCLVISKRFFHAFVGATCVRAGSERRLTISACLSAPDARRFSFFSTAAGLSISVSPGRGHPAYNTPYFNLSAPILPDDRRVAADGRVVEGFYPTVAVRAGHTLSLTAATSQIFELPNSEYGPPGTLPRPSHDPSMTLPRPFHDPSPTLASTTLP